MGWKQQSGRGRDWEERIEEKLILSFIICTNFILPQFIHSSMYVFIFLTQFNLKYYLYYFSFLKTIFRISLKFILFSPFKFQENI